MTLTWSGNMAGQLREILAKSQRLDDDLYEGAKIVLADADRRVPKESGNLSGRGEISRGRGGNSTVAIVFASVYARWIHEHLNFKHPHGGEAKFLETALLVKGGAAMNEAGEHLWRRL